MINRLLIFVAFVGSIVLAIFLLTSFPYDESEVPEAADNFGGGFSSDETVGRSLATGETSSVDSRAALPVDTRSLPIANDSAQVENQRIGTYGFDALAYADIAFEREWSDFVSALDLTEVEKSQLKEIITGYTAYNMELLEQARNGLITASERRDAFLKPQDLEERVSLVLSAEQMELFRANQRKILEDFETDTNATTQTLIESGTTDILMYSSLNDLNTVRAYIASGTDVNTRPIDGGTSPLHNAIRRNNAEMAQALIEAGADVNWPTDTYNVSPLIEAARIGNTHIINELVVAGADMEFYPPEFVGYTALAEAAGNGHTDAVATLLTLGADATGEAGSNALAYAIRNGYQKMERFLINAGANSGSQIVEAARRSRDRRASN